MTITRTEQRVRRVHAEPVGECGCDARRRRSSRRIARGVAALAVGVSCSMASAQPGASQPATVIQNARILTMAPSQAGDAWGIIEGGTIIFRGDRIERVGRNLQVPPRSQVIDGTGLTVTPGFIDADGSLAMDSGGQGDATNLAFDGFDTYAHHDIREALSQGVTAVVVSPRGGLGVGGMSQVVRLTIDRRTPRRGTAMEDGQAIHLDLGSSSATIRRIQTVDQLRRQLKAALEWREANETYKEELAEYEKKIKERAEKASNETPRTGGSGGDGQGATTAQQPGARPTGAQPAQGGQQTRQDEIKKPTEPARNPAAAVLLRAIDREIPVRVEAHRAGDILSALALAEEFGLRVIVTGASEAHHVADRLAAAKVPVVLSPVIGAPSWLDVPTQSPAVRVSKLTRAGVTIALGTGSDGATSRFLLTNAQAAASGYGTPDALRTITIEAARTLGLADRIGSIEAGKLADLVIWSGDPLDPSSRVEQTWVGGLPAYTRDTGEDAGAL